jgi:hypothetical protein
MAIVVAVSAVAVADAVFIRSSRQTVTVAVGETVAVAVVFRSIVSYKSQQHPHPQQHPQPLLLLSK